MERIKETIEELKQYCNENEIFCEMDAWFINKKEKLQFKFEL